MFSVNILSRKGLIFLEYHKETLAFCILKVRISFLSSNMQNEYSYSFPQEYVVEDRESNKDVPGLDPGHVTELRMLGLY